MLLAALAVEFADELVDGTKSAAMPLIRHDLSLSYVQIGLLGAVPLIAGSILELPVGVLSGTGARRRRMILGGGLVFVAAVLGAGLARSFTGMLIALVVFFPASGAFVSLTQSALMDAAPDRQAQHMARWTLAGSAGAGAGSLLVAAVLGAGGSWRLAFIMVAGCGLAAWLGVTAAGRKGIGGIGAASGGATADDEVGSGWPGWREAAIIVRRSGALRWLALLEVSDLLLDVLTAFLALYLVAVAHASLLAGLTIATAPWYPVVTAELFGSLSGHSGLAVSLSSAAGLVGGLGPLAVGLLAQHFGLSWAMTALCLVPVAMLAVHGGRQRAGPGAGPDDGRDASARLGCRG